MVGDSHNICPEYPSAWSRVITNLNENLSSKDSCQKPTRSSATAVIARDADAGAHTLSSMIHINGNENITLTEKF